MAFMVPTKIAETDLDPPEHIGGAICFHIYSVQELSHLHNNKSAFSTAVYRFLPE